MIIYKYIYRKILKFETTVNIIKVQLAVLSILVLINTRLLHVFWEYFLYLTNFKYLIVHLRLHIVGKYDSA